MARIAILGAGTWGIALARVLDHIGHEVTIWSAHPEKLAALEATREHGMLPGEKLPETLRYTADDAEAVTGRDLVVMAVASSYTRSIARRFSARIAQGQILAEVAKGIEEGTLMTLTEQIEEEIPQADVCVLSGPTHAEEVVKLMPTTIVAAAHSRQTAEFVQNLFMCECFRVYTSSDIQGVELGGALKNVVALAAGIADGLGYGDNAKAALITRGIAEITRLGVRMGAQAETFGGLTGIGDLIVTCTSMHSRNRRAGILIGQGKSLEEAQREVGMVVEGVYSAKAALALARKYDVQMPITKQINLVLFEGKNPADAVGELMLRDKKMELVDMGW